MTSNVKVRAVGFMLAAMVFGWFTSPSAHAIDPQDNRPYWTGVPTGGFLQECVGQVVALKAYGLIPARSTYTETRYSSGGGYCNNALTRPTGMIEATAKTFNTYGTLCDSQFRQNSSSSAWNVTATASSCQTATVYLLGESRYDNVNAGYPTNSVYAS